MSTLRAALLSSALSLTVGCGFFTLDDADKPVKGKPTTTTGGTGGADVAGMGGTVAIAGGAGGSGGSGGTGGDAGMTTTGGSGGTGGSSGSGTGGTAAGAGGTTGGTGGDMMAGSGGSSAGAPPLGGSGGDVALGGMGGAMAGGPAGGMGGSAGGGATTCATLNSGSQAFGGHCYLLVTSTVDFAAAKSACSGMSGAHLVTISNGMPAAQATFDAEDQFIYTLAAGKDTWLGLADGKMDTDAPDGTFYTWINGEDSPPAEWGTAYGWVDGEPNNYKKTCASGNGDCYEHCGMMVADQGGKWNDDLCLSTKQYVCEWDMGG